MTFRKKRQEDRPADQGERRPEPVRAWDQVLAEMVKLRRVTAAVEQLAREMKESGSR